MLSRKTYRDVARIIRDAKADVRAKSLDASSVGELIGILTLQLALTDYFAHDNPRFDSDRFLEAAM